LNCRKPEIICTYTTSLNNEKTYYDKELVMKKLVLWVLISAFALSLTACAGSMGGENVRVKCPSCGYEFDVDRRGH
jgi:hypothetical protein